MARDLPRGAVVRVNLTGHAEGSEAGATHPLLAVVVQSDQFRLGRTVLLVPFTTNLDRARDPFGVLVQHTEANRLAANSVAMCWQVMAVDRNRLVGPPLGRVSPAVLDLVAKNVVVLIDYEPGYLSRTGASAPGEPPAGKS